MQLIVTICDEYSDDVELSLIEGDSVSLSFNTNENNARILISHVGKQLISMREFGRKEIHKVFEDWLTKNAPIRDTRDFGAFKKYHEGMLD